MALDNGIPVDHMELLEKERDSIINATRSYLEDWIDEALYDAWELGYDYALSQVEAGEGEEGESSPFELSHPWCVARKGGDLIRSLFETNESARAFVARTGEPDEYVIFRLKVEDGQED